MKEFKEFIKEKRDPFANLDKATALAKIANSGKDAKLDGVKVTAKQASELSKLYDILSDKLKKKFNSMSMKDLNSWLSKARGMKESKEINDSLTNID